MGGFQNFMITVFFGLSLLVCPSHQDCKVLSQCQNDLSWKPWPPEIERGYPGKSGAPGPPGNKGAKGDPGEVIVINSTYEKSDNGPTREFLSHSMTWDTAKYYCQGKGRRLCRGNEICIHEGRGRRMIHDVIEGDHWTPIIDGANKWLQIGDSRRFTCYTHTETHGGSQAGGWISHTPYRHKGYVYCCGRKDEGVTYRYIGKTATYDKGNQHCSSLGKRLCYASEVCNGNVPVYGTIVRDTWVPVNDRHNEWVQIGNSRTCFVHGIHYSAPSWGTRTDGSEYDFLGFVLCC